MLRKLHSIRLPNSISGLAGANGRIIAVDSLAQRVHSVVVENGKLAHVATVNFDGPRPWLRTFPFVEQATDYIRVNNPDCAFTQDGDLSALSTPGAPVQLLSLPDLCVSGELGESGEAKSLCFIDKTRQLIGNRLAGAFPQENLHGESFCFDVPTGTRHVVSKWLLGRNIVCGVGSLLTWCDCQGETQIHMHETTPPFRTRDIRMVCCVRPDGIAVSRTGRLAAAVELDYFHKLIVIDTITFQRKLSTRYAGETNRPDHALNLALAGFDSAERIYVPAPTGVIVRFDLADGQKEESRAHSAELTGLLTFPDPDLLVSSDIEGTISLWACDVSNRLQADIVDKAVDIPFLSSEQFTREIAFGDEQFAFSP